MLVLTATARQARFLRDRWASQQLADGHTVWETPPMLSVQAWMRQQWELLLQRGVELPLLLSPDQERAVWQQCRPDALREAEGFLRQGDLVEHAMRANRLFHLWRAPEESLQQLLSDTHLEEVELFAQWQQQFAAQCAAMQWLEGARLAEQITVQIIAGDVLLPQQVAHYRQPGWCRTEQQLLQTLQLQGVVLSEYRIEPLTPVASLVVTADPEQEIHAAAVAIRQQLEVHPGQRIGVVVPGLLNRAQQIDQIFSERLVPQASVTALTPDQRPYRLSTGQPLLNDPRIHHALQLLKLKQQPLPLLEVAALLRSPWLLLGAEMEPRSQLEVVLRSWGLLEVSLATLIQLFQPVQGVAAAAPRFLGALQALHALEMKQTVVPHHWAQQITSALAFFEWAENGEQSVVALAAYNGWREGMDRFVALGECVGAIHVGEALSRLSRLLSAIELDEGRESRAIEVLTPEEADGVQFEWLWVMGCDDSTWPQSEALSPLLPHGWQRERLPSVEHHQAQQQGRALFKRLQSASAQLHFSYSRSEEAGGEQERHLTPLLGSVLQQPFEADGEPAWWLPQQPLQMEPIEDRAVALAEGSRVSGGSSLLANQAQCPFRAFVRHRLRVEPMEMPQPGLDARERGTLLHELLERCWREIGESSVALQQLDAEGLQRTVEKIAAGTVEQFRHARRQRIGLRFAENEQQRLTQLAVEALTLDQQREAAFEVEEMERQHSIELGGLSLSVKMDRVDRLKDGRRVLIDYKSGQVNRAEWSGERPQAPQLPLYTLLLEQVSAVLYAQIRAQEVLYKGVQEQAEVMQGAAGGKRHPTVEAAEEWMLQLQQWQHALEALALEFRTGVAAVAPYHGARSCLYCGLEPLCRVEI